jgi:hypothetical protein
LPEGDLTNDQTAKLWAKDRVSLSNCGDRLNAVLKAEEGQ